MNTTIDNFDRIKSLMPFGEEENLFMHLQILRRGKDHPNLPMLKEFEEGFIAGGASADDLNWYDAKVMRPNHMQICYCYDKYMGGGRVYVYDDISKYWCSANTEEHDPDGDNHVCDYGDFRVTHWRPNREDKPISE